ncbi:hypothetical protein Tco_1484814 [Tanacetum coccineum]
MVPLNNLRHDLSGKAINETQYRGMIGSLMYLTTSRPDIQFSTCLCARYQATPKESHLIVVKRIFRYLKGTPSLGLWYPKCLGFDLKGYSSAKKQQSVAMSSAEAEYVAAGGCYHILKGDIELHFIPTHYQRADIFTRPLDELTSIKNGLLVIESSSQKPSSPEITPKEEPVTLDKPKSLNPFLPTSQVNFTFDEITFTTNNEVALLYPLHPNQEYFKDLSDFISKCCLNETFTKAPTQYKEYLSEFWYTTKTLEGSKVWVSTPTGRVRGYIGGKTGGLDQISNKDVTILYCLANGVQVDYAKIIWEDLIHKLNKKTREKIVPYPRLTDILKDTRSAFTPDSSPDEPIIVLDESEKEEEVTKDKDNEATSHDVPKDTSVPPPPSPKSAQIQELMAQVHLLQSQKEELEQAKAKAEAEVASMKAKPSYPDITQLTELLIKELKKHVRDMEIELHRDLKEIPTKLKTFTFTISSLSSQVAKLKNIQWELPAEFLNLPSQVSLVQEKFKTLDSLPSLLHKVCHNGENASGATSMNVPSAGKATDSLAEGEKNTKDAEANLQKQLINLLGIEVVSDLHSTEWREVIQACPNKSEKGWKTIYDLVKTRLDQLTQTEQELKIDLNKPLKEQDPLNELNELANKKRKRTSDLKDHSRGRLLGSVPEPFSLSVLRRLGSIFTSVYAAVQKLKKDSWKELQFSLVDNSKLNVVYLLNRS